MNGKHKGIEMKRSLQIDKAIADLKKYAKGLNPDSAETWAVQVNVSFLKACRSPLRYVKWLKANLPELRKPQNRKRLIELADFALPFWAAETHRTFIRLERLPFPGLLKPIRKELENKLKWFSENKNEAVVVAGLGSGAMELERQLIQRLGGLSNPVVFVGVDCSESITKVASENFQDLKNSGLIRFMAIDSIDEEKIKELKDLAEKCKCHIVAVFVGDVFELGESLEENTFDIVYHARLKHHIDQNKRDELDKMVVNLGKVAVEMDDYYDPSVFPFPSIITWGKIATLNGAIVSYIRDPSKKELIEEQKKKETEGWTLWIHPILGYYLRINDQREI